MADNDDDDPLKKMGQWFKDATAAGGNDKVVPIGPKREEKQRKKAEEQARRDRDKGKQFQELGENCPVRPLGCNLSNYYFLDAIDQLIVKPADKLGQNGIDDLFKHPLAQRWGEENFPRYSMWGNIVGIDRDRLKRALMARCGELTQVNGIFDPSGRVRGDGGWADELGHLVFHCGDVIITADAEGRLYESRPGVHDTMIYPKGTAQLRPAAEPCDASLALELLELLRSWHWKRGDLDAMLMLGWIVMAPVAGAMRWRPSLWVTGDQATGKSTLQTTIRYTQGANGIIQAADATPAGIWQALKFRSLPVALDEVEATKDNTKREAIIDLMRISASGALLRRGGQDHEPVYFNVFAPFMFSSINMLPLAPQDLSRMALLELLELDANAPRPRLDPLRLAKVGRSLRRRVVMAWPRWQEHLDPWWNAIGREHDQRTADTFGFLLAMAHLAVCSEPAHADTVDEAIAPLLPSLLEWKEIAGRDCELMLNRLATWQLEPWDKGRKITVRQLIYWASDRTRVPPRSATDEEERFGPTVSAIKARGALRMQGLAVIRTRIDPQPGQEYLAIAFRHDALGRIFRGTKWQDGVWRQAAGRVPGAVPRRVKFDNWPEGAVLVPLAAILGDDGADDCETPHSPAS